MHKSEGGGGEMEDTRASKIMPLKLYTHSLCTTKI